MSFLSKLSSLRKSAPPTPITVNKTPTGPVEREHSLLPKNYVREEDPAVKRLKELRRQELLKKGELSKKAKSDKPTAAKRKKDESSSTETRFKRKASSVPNKSRTPTFASKKAQPLKKLSFEELMKQAETNAKHPKDSNGSKSSSEDVPAKSMPSSQREANHSKSQERKKSRPKEGNKRTPSSNKPTLKTTPGIERRDLVKIKAPSYGLAQPNKKIRERLESKRRKSFSREEATYESDMDDFIEDDENDGLMESNRDAGFDRDEIWALFNRGKKRSDYAFDDYEDDDMEANEMEIFEEEERARKMARLEDKREEEWLKRHEQEKKRRKRTRE